MSVDFHNSTANLKSNIPAFIWYSLEIPFFQLTKHYTEEEEEEEGGVGKNDNMNLYCLDIDSLL